MLYRGEEMEERAVLQAAAEMCAAARTAPKAHGKDTLRTVVLIGDEKEELARVMERIGEREMGDKAWTWYGRDAANVRAAGAVVLIGAEKKSRGVPHCGCCNFADCAACRRAGGTCAFVFIDLGIAVSSAVSAASRRMVDSRVMYSVGKAAAEMAFGAGFSWLGVPLSVSGKNIFFDRGVVHD
ncbi:DUF2148 domain-containing protein [uncultured Cloacibacillus sp.]|uniref:DUF2148 domain-containing protein n=1 Tax=uncultured Cloacibacillus sp. TaxID=889794 RepID=UPI0026DB0D22|nr:DUF2148 domain-containing protein [uncultured Cloacibacillus sp.]